MESIPTIEVLRQCLPEIEEAWALVNDTALAENEELERLTREIAELEAIEKDTDTTRANEHGEIERLTAFLGQQTENCRSEALRRLLREVREYVERGEGVKEEIDEELVGVGRALQELGKERDQREIHKKELGAYLSKLKYVKESVEGGKLDDTAKEYLKDLLDKGILIGEGFGIKH